MSTSRVLGQSSTVLSDEERRARLHRAYLYILSLRAKHNADLGRMTDTPSPSSAEEIPDSEDGDKKDDAPNEPEKQMCRAGRINSV